MWRKIYKTIFFMVALFIIVRCIILFAKEDIFLSLRGAIRDELELHIASKPCFTLPFNSYRGIRLSGKLDLSNLSNHQLKVELPTEARYDVSGSCRKEVFLLVLVVSHPKNVDRRELIRKTWGNMYERDIQLLKSPKPFKTKSLPPEQIFKVFFLLGGTKENSAMEVIFEESELKQDIVVGNFVDSYKNLTMKTRLGLKWAYHKCISKYILKTDDDVFVNPIWMVEWLKKAPLSKYYTGCCDRNAPAIRDKDSKWYVSYAEYPHKVYPTYCLGLGYIISRDVLEDIVSISYGRDLFPMEDLYVALLIHELRDVPVIDARRHFKMEYRGTRSACKLKDLFLAHRVVEDSLIEHVNRVRKAFLKC